jgi:ATP-dependent Clp protease ATP-binding subunit ClpC
MAARNVPVLVWQDDEGFFSAAPVTLADWRRPVVAAGATATGALEQVRAYFEWLAKEYPWHLDVEFLDPQLVQVKVPIRPQYVHEGRIYPCDEEIPLRVPCVYGRQESGMVICSLPTLGMMFYCYEPEAVKPMVCERVRQEFGARTPRELSRLLAPRALRLEQVIVRLPKGTRQGMEQAPPTLALVAQPLGDPSMRKRFSAAYGREQAVADLVTRLAREKASVILVGEHGVGKSTLLTSAVRTIERTQDAGQTGRRRRRFWMTAAARIIAGMRYLGQWEERCEAMIGELAEIDGVLCVENLLDLLLLGGTGPGDSIAAFFLPYLQNGELRLVGEAAPAELDACRRHLPGFVEAFQVLRVEALPDREAREALAQVAAAGVQETRIAIAEDLTPTVYRLFRRFLPYCPMPGRAAGFLRELFDAWEDNVGQVSNLPVRSPQETSGTPPDDRKGDFQSPAAEPRPTDATNARQRASGTLTLRAEHAMARFIDQTGLPELMLRDDRPLRIEEVEQALRERIIGQDAACREMARVITAFKAGLNDPRRPLGVLLFCGPTGVGKTELAKTASDYLFGHGKNADRLVRLDMSEYSSPWAAERLLTTDGRTPSDFVQRMRQQPFVVVLLDEIEKAAPEVFDMLLAVLDEGRLADRYGRTTNFRSAIIVMTSNLGASNQGSIGFTSEPPAPYESAAYGFFRPEFFNRIDALVTFRPLGPEVCLAITRKELHEVARREGLLRADLRLEVSDALVRRLAQDGFDPRYGARPLQRILEARFVSVLSRFLVQHPGLRKATIFADLEESGQVVLAAR